MITVDAGRRAARLEELMQALERHSDPADRELLRSFAPVVYDSLPDAVALGLSIDALTRRMLDYFRFFVREFPPPTQVYRGLPGIHVVVRNPVEADEQRIVHGRILPLETTIVETHTLDAPFIFESLKNYFRRAGLRVFSAIHPMLSVRRQWERIVALGPPQEEGSRESFCHFRIERVDSKERLARIEHEIYSVLKAVFTAVEDFEDMRRVVRELGPKLRDRKPGAGRAEPARGFLDWLLADNYIFLGTVKYVLGRDGRFERAQETATGVFTDRDLLPVVFPGLMDEVETHLVPNENDPRIVDIDYCNNAMAIYHLEPIDDIEIRHWGEDGSLQEMTLLLGRLSMGAFTEKASEIPLLKEKHDWILANSGAAQKSYAYREIRALFNRFPKRELFYASAPSLKDVIERIVYMTGDDDVAVHSRRGAGYVALSIAFSRLRYSYKAEEDLKHALTEAYGPIAFSSSTDCGAVTLLLCYFDSSRMERPVDNDEVRRMTEGLVTTWEDRVAAALEAALGEREGRRLFQSYIRSESRSGLYRESTPPEEVPARHPQPREPRGPPAGRRPAALRGDGHPEAVLAPGARPHPDPAHAAEPRGHGHRGAPRPPHPARGAQGVPLPVRDRDHAGADREPGHRRGALRRRAARPRRGDGDRRRAERPRPPGGPVLARGRAAAHAPQPPAADPHPLQRGDRERRPAAQQRGGGVAVPLLRGALRPRRSPTAARPASPPPTPR